MALFQYLFQKIAMLFNGGKFADWGLYFCYHLLAYIFLLPFFGGLRAERLQERAKSTTVFAVMEDERIEEARAIVNRVTGGLNRPDSGIMFALPVSFADGILHPDSADPAS